MRVASLLSDGVAHCAGVGLRDLQMKKAVVLAILAGCLWSPCAWAQGVQKAANAAHVANSRRDIRIVDLQGLEAAIAKHRGKAILVNFWAIWCEPCVEELPEFLATGREYRGKNGVVLTVSYDLMIPDVTKAQVLKDVRAFAARRRIDAPVFVYDAPDYDAINDRFGLPGPVPVTIAIDAAGRIVDRHTGQARRDDFRQMMQKALGK